MDFELSLKSEDNRESNIIPMCTTMLIDAARKRQSLQLKPIIVQNVFSVVSGTGCNTKPLILDLLFDST